MNKLQIPFGKTAAQITKSTGDFISGDVGYIDGYVPLGSTVYAVFVRSGDGKIGAAPIERIEGLLAEEMLG